MQNTLSVYREFKGRYEKAGDLRPTEAGLRFRYCDSYLASPEAAAISHSLPLQDEAFGEQLTRAFFDGLLAEGRPRRVLSQSFHVDDGDYPSLLAKLNNESIGALILSSGEVHPEKTRGYSPLSFEEISRFAQSPSVESARLNAASRLSLAGAQTKIGLKHEGDDMRAGWYLPKGSASSTHILKAVDGTFPLQTINEALCMLAAKLYGFDVAECTLIPMDNCEPILAIRRFDRVDTDDAFPARIHQEDFSQALGWPSSLKYEPTDGNYLSCCASLIARVSANPFGDRHMFYSSLLFDWAIGNCDNHLKNHSFIYDSFWEKRELSPLYDVTCTTFYPLLDDEMGISLCPSRKIDDVSASDLANAALICGIPQKMAECELSNLAKSFIPALRKARTIIENQGFGDVTAVAEHIEHNFTKRLAKAGISVN